MRLKARVWRMCGVMCLFVRKGDFVQGVRSDTGTLVARDARRGWESTYGMTQFMICCVQNVKRRTSTGAASRMLGA